MTSMVYYDEHVIMANVLLWLMCHYDQYVTMASMVCYDKHVIMTNVLL